MSWPEVPSGVIASFALSLAVIAAGYIIGCFNTGYYLVRWFRSGDIREEGSGSTGATNVGRSLGTSGFLFTLAADTAKGAFAVWIALHFRLGSWALLLTILAVIAGHVWPAQLRFRGGKGITPLVGALLIADYFVLMISLILFLGLFAVLRRFTLSGLAALALTAPTLSWWDRPAGRAFGFLLLVAPVLYAHRQNLREDLTLIRGDAAGKGSAGTSLPEE